MLKDIHSLVLKSAFSCVKLLSDFCVCLVLWSIIVSLCYEQAFPKKWNILAEPLWFETALIVLSPSFTLNFVIDINNQTNCFGLSTSDIQRYLVLKKNSALLLLPIWLIPHPPSSLLTSPPIPSHFTIKLWMSLVLNSSSIPYTYWLNKGFHPILYGQHFTL